MQDDNQPNQDSATNSGNTTSTTPQPSSTTVDQKVLQLIPELVQELPTKQQQPIDPPKKKTIQIILIVLLIVPVGFLFNWENTREAYSFVTTSNPAYQKLNPVIKKVGGKQICFNGDSGKSLDNTTPWYDSYYYIKDDTNLAQSVINAAAQSNYKLVADNNKTNEKEQNSQNDYLISHDKSVNVEIIRQSSIQLVCINNNNGTQALTPPNGEAIISWHISL